MDKAQLPVTVPVTLKRAHKFKYEYIVKPELELIKTSRLWRKRWTKFSGVLGK